MDRKNRGKIRKGTLQMHYGKNREGGIAILQSSFCKISEILIRGGKVVVEKLFKLGETGWWTVHHCVQVATALPLGFCASARHSAQG